MQLESKAIQVLPWLPSQLKIAPPTEPRFCPCSQDVVFSGQGLLAPVLCVQSKVPLAAWGPQLAQALGPMAGGLLCDCQRGLPRVPSPAMSLLHFTEPLPPYHPLCLISSSPSLALPTPHTSLAENPLVPDPVGPCHVTECEPDSQGLVLPGWSSGLTGPSATTASLPLAKGFPASKGSWNFVYLHRQSQRYSFIAPTNRLAPPGHS